MLSSSGIKAVSCLAVRSFSTSSLLRKVEDKKMMLRSLPVKDMCTEGVESVDLDAIIGK